jgi:hypothetical protein
MLLVVPQPESANATQAGSAQFSADRAHPYCSSGQYALGHLILHQKLFSSPSARVFFDWPRRSHRIARLSCFASSAADTFMYRRSVYPPHPSGLKSVATASLRTTTRSAD